VLQGPCVMAVFGVRGTAPALTSRREILRTFLVLTVSLGLTYVLGLEVLLSKLKEHSLFITVIC